MARPGADSLSSEHCVEAFEVVAENRKVRGEDQEQQCSVVNARLRAHFPQVGENLTPLTRITAVRFASFTELMGELHFEPKSLRRRAQIERERFALTQRRAQRRQDKIAALTMWKLPTDGRRVVRLPRHFEVRPQATGECVLKAPLIPRIEAVRRLLDCQVRFESVEGDRQGVGQAGQIPRRRRRHVGDGIALRTTRLRENAATGRWPFLATLLGSLRGFGGEKRQAAAAPVR
jgi:hypothetical protein